MALLTLADLRALHPTIDDDKAQALIEDAVSFAKVKVPGLSGTLTNDQESAIRGVLREQVLHRYEVGDGGTQQETAGPFSRTIFKGRAPIVSDHALGRLRDILGIRGRAFMIDTTPAEVEEWPDELSVW